MRLWHQLVKEIEWSHAEGQRKRLMCNADQLDHWHNPETMSTFEVHDYIRTRLVQCACLMCNADHLDHNLKTMSTFEVHDYVRDILVQYASSPGPLDWGLAPGPLVFKVDRVYGLCRGQPGKIEATMQDHVFGLHKCCIRINMAKARCEFQQGGKWTRRLCKLRCYSSITKEYLRSIAIGSDWAMTFTIKQLQPVVPADDNVPLEFHLKWITLDQFDIRFFVRPADVTWTLQRHCDNYHYYHGMLHFWGTQ